MIYLCGDTENKLKTVIAAIICISKQALDHF